MDSLKSPRFKGSLVREEKCFASYFERVSVVFSALSEGFFEQLSTMAFWNRFCRARRRATQGFAEQPACHWSRFSSSWKSCLDFLRAAAVLSIRCSILRFRTARSAPHPIYSSGCAWLCSSVVASVAANCESVTI